jgi:predicted nucleic acid-binding protein
MKIYFDSCCYGRQWDDQKDTQIATDTLAIMTIIEAARLAGRSIGGSTVVAFELGNIPSDHPNRADILAFYDDTIDESTVLTPAELTRAQSLRAEGVGKMDSRHLAVAEAAGVDYLITTDEKFERVVTKKNLSEVKVIHPLTYLAGGIK